MFVRSSCLPRLRDLRPKTGLCAGLIGLGVLATAASPAPAAEGAAPELSFAMVRSATAVAANCLVGASATVTITKLEQAERMTIVARGLPADTEFDVFVIQVPDAPFGLSWYQGDLETDPYGNARVQFIGRFNEETFIVAPGAAPAPRVHRSPPFPDAGRNPATAPVHTYHLGIWFNSPDDARAAGCPDAVTPFNGDHDAGIQALSTRNITGPFGPLHRID